MIRRLCKRYLTQTVIPFATPSRLRTYRRLILMLVAVLWVGVLGRVAVNLTDGELNRNDFLGFYTAGSFFIEGRQEDLYDIESQRSFERALARGNGPEDGGVNLFINPPFAVLLYAPFAFAPFHLALFLWTVVGLLAASLSLAWIWRATQASHGLSFRELSLYAFVFFPTSLWIVFGQATGLLFLLLTASVLLLRAGRDFWSGFVLGLLAFKPQIALCIALPILVKGRFAAMAGGALSVGAWMAVGLLVFPEEMATYWALRDDIVAVLTHSGYQTWGIVSVYGFFHLLLGALSTNLADALTLGVTVGLLGWLARYWWKTEWAPGSAGWDRAMAGTMAIGLLLGLHLFAYDLALMLIPFLLAVASYPPANGYRLDGGALLAASLGVVTVSWVGFAISKTTEELTKGDGGGTALQLMTLAIIGWGVVAIRQASSLGRTAPTAAPSE